ncbi:MAG: flagellar hook-associated protein FlgK [Alphaproteobacteria bacterium]|nr:flagellar hook-associated protein FlgK [Alphaproteobacteria bacterium]
MALIPSLTTSLSGMKAAQGQLDIISRNVSNVDTEGYSRKTAQQHSVVRAGSSMGVELGNVTRQVDEGLLKSYLSSNSLTNNYSAKNDYLSKIEVTLGTPQGNNSISANVSDLQTAFESLATDVTSSAGRYNLLNQATTLTARLNSVSAEIQVLRGDADLQITENVEEINKLLDTIDHLNEELVKYELLNYDGVADLQDQRDTALRELSAMIDISYFKRDNGSIVIQTTNGITLLDSDPHKLSHAAVAKTSPTVTYASGGIGGIYVDGKDITGYIKNGEIKGLIEVRDVILPSLQSQLDELSGTLKDTINSVHNRGTAYPNTPSTLTGTKVFLQDDNGNYVQNIKIESGDVRLMIVTPEGEQFATTTLKGELGFAQGSLDDMAQTIQNWLRSANGPNLPQAEVYFNNDGQLIISTGDSEYGLSIIDTMSSTPGTEQKDAVIAFDAGANGIYGQTYAGFADFFGLNDVFVDDNRDYIYDSNVVNLNANLGVNQTTVWSFSDEVYGLNYATISISPSDSLSQIVKNINDDPVLSRSIRASLVPNGSGYVFRIENLNGGQLEISETQGNNLLGRLGLTPSNAGVAQQIKVRQDITTNPSLIAGGAPEFNKSTGRYVLSPAANSIANEMGEVFALSQNFKQSGTIAQTQTNLASYAATFVGNIASQTSNAQNSFEYQQTLTQSISTKEAQISGVDLDEELGQMIIFQQSYAACAQAFTASKEILDMLLNIV